MDYDFNYVNIIVPAISALVGGLIAFLTTMSVTRSKAKTDRSKELMNLAVQAGIEAFKADMQAHRNHDKPMSFYIYFHYNYLHLVENGTATPENIKEICDKQEELLKVVHEGAWGRVLSQDI